MHIHSYLFGASGLVEITGEVDDPCKTRKKRLSSKCMRCSSALSSGLTLPAPPPPPMKNARRAAAAGHKTTQRRRRPPVRRRTALTRTHIYVWFVESCSQKPDRYNRLNDKQQVLKTVG